MIFAYTTECAEGAFPFRKGTATNPGGDTASRAMRVSPFCTGRTAGLPEEPTASSGAGSWQPCPFFMPSIHRSAWKGRSPKFACSILHSPDPSRQVSHSLPNPTHRT
jgi:hypothetical protein